MALVQTAVTGVGSTYHKIDTLFERDERFIVDPTRLKHPVLATISQWNVTEKIDGTNLRVMLSETGEVSFGGRSDNAQLPAELLMKLMHMFPAEKMKAALWLDGEPTPVVLYLEGYGAGIQKGGLYRPDKSAILYDVLAGGKWWLDKEALGDVAHKLNIEVVPYYGRMTLDQIVELVKTPFPSRIGAAQAEGIVARPIETLFDRRGERIIFKLKTRDFLPCKR